MIRKFWTLITTFALVGLGLFTVPTLAYAQEGENAVPDPVLQKIINKKLKREESQPVTVADLQSLSGSLSLSSPYGSSDEYVTNLEGLQYTTKLTRVDSVNLRYITSLEKLSGNQLRSMSLIAPSSVSVLPEQIKTLVKEEITLHLEDNNSLDLRALSGSEIKRLTLQMKNSSVSLDPLDGKLANLTSFRVDLYGPCAVTSSQEINLPQAYLYVSVHEGAADSDISGLNIKGVGKLTLEPVISLPSMAIIAPLTNVTSLDTTAGYARAPQSFDGIENLTKLESARILVTDGLSLEKFRGLSHLKEMKLWVVNGSTNPPIDSLAALSQLEKVSLYYSGNTQANVAALANMTGLKDLDIEARNAKVDVSALKVLTGLERLRIRSLGSDLRDLKTLVNLKNLEFEVDGDNPGKLFNYDTFMAMRNLEGLKITAKIPMNSDFCGLADFESYHPNIAKAGPNTRADIYLSAIQTDERGVFYVPSFPLIENGITPANGIFRSTSTNIDIKDLGNGYYRVTNASASDIAAGKSFELFLASVVPNIAGIYTNVQMPTTAVIDNQPLPADYHYPTPNLDTAPCQALGIDAYRPHFNEIAANATDLSSSSLATITTAPQIADKDSAHAHTVTVSLENQYGKPLHKNARFLSLRLADSPENAPYHASGANQNIWFTDFTQGTDDNGKRIYTAKVTSTKAGTPKLEAAYTDVRTKNVAIVPVTNLTNPQAYSPAALPAAFTAGPVDLAKSSFEVDATARMVGTLPAPLIKVTLRDSNNNPVTGYDLSNAVSCTKDNKTATVDTFTYAADTDYTANVTSTVSGDFTCSVHVGNQALSVAAPGKDVAHFIPSNAKKATIELSPADLYPQDTVTATIKVMDEGNNPVARGTSISVKLTSPSPSSRSGNPRYVTDENGIVFVADEGGNPTSEKPSFTVNRGGVYSITATDITAGDLAQATFKVHPSTPVNLSANAGSVSGNAADAADESEVDVQKGGISVAQGTVSGGAFTATYLTGYTPTDQDALTVVVTDKVTGLSSRAGNVVLSNPPVTPPNPGGDTGGTTGGSDTGGTTGGSDTGGASGGNNNPSGGSGQTPPPGSDTAAGSVPNSPSSAAKLPATGVSTLSLLAASVMLASLGITLRRRARR